MLSLCNILMESQHKVSSAIEQSLRKEGVVVDPPAKSAPASTPEDESTALKAAALNRIEDLLTTVLGRLDGSPAASPEQSPERFRQAPTRQFTPTPVAKDPKQSDRQVSP